MRGGGKRAGGGGAQAAKRRRRGGGEAETRAVLRRLAPSYVPEEAPGLEAQCGLLHELLERTLVAEANNACLLVGPRGAGKTLAVRHAMRRLRREHAPSGRNFVEVRLSGHLQTDDTLAMREICRQLCAEHNLEMLPAQGFAENLRFLLEVLERCKEMRLPVFFVLDEFDLFASRAKQTLLYNLCDLLQSSLAQIAIVGTTTRLDAYELLEKRIRSRISYRRVLFPGLASPEVLARVARGALALPDAEGGGEEQRAAVDRALAAPAARDRLRLYHELGRTAGWVRLLLATSAGRRGARVALEAGALDEAAALLVPDWKAETMAACSVLELCLAVAMSHLERRGHAAYNFVRVHAEYERFQRELDGVSADVFSRRVCFKAWERLALLGVSEHVEAAASDTYAAKQFRRARLALEPLDVRDLVARLACPTWLKQWSTRWVA